MSGGHTMSNYGITAIKIAKSEIKENEKIINDLTRAVCAKTEEIEKLKSQLAECKKAIGSDN